MFRSRRGWPVVILALVISAMLGWAGMAKVKQNSMENIARMLDSVLKTTHRSVNLWIKGRLSGLDHIARRPDIIKSVKVLDSLKSTREGLLLSPAQAEVSGIFVPIVQEHGDKGFMVVALNGTVMSASESALVGDRVTVPALWESLSRARQGDVSIVMPVRGEGGEPQMYIVIPVKEGGEIFASLVFIVDPYVEFAGLSHIAISGETGDPYLFNRDAIMISAGRFEEQLRQVGLLDNDKKATLNVEIRSPGGDMTAGFIPVLPLEQRPLTHMSAEALSGRMGLDVEGYSDYRGVQVVGAWLWDADYEYGMAFEMDIHEAYASYYFIRMVIIFVTSLIIYMFVLLYLAVVKRHKQMSKSNARLKAEVLERENAEALLKWSLAEKEVLLQEVHHRVKNNLAVISSLLSLQAMRVTDPDVKVMFEEGRNRVMSIALVHEKLYQSTELSNVDPKDFFTTLVHNLYSTYGISEHDIAFEVNLDEMRLDIDTLIPCALIVNELVTNSLKYAFEMGRDDAIIRISFQSEGDGNIVLSVSDNGKGFPRGFDMEKTGTLGLQIVNTLAHQLEGTIAQKDAEGVAFEIRFHVDE